MKLRTAILLGVASGVGFAIAWHLRRTQRPLRITSNDLRYREKSAQQLASEKLLDLNTADPTDLGQLGLDSEMCGQIINNRPYRNKLDLLSRMVIPETLYNGIKDQIGVAGATEPIKVG